jgi:hypothetical protein
MLGFVASLLATFTAPSIGSAFGKLKSGFIERNKSKALAGYDNVRSLKSGKRDKYLYALTSWGFTLSFQLFFVVSSAVFLRSTNMRLAVALFIFVVFTALCSTRWMLDAVITLSRLENFEDYRAELLERWPDIELADAE